MTPYAAVRVLPVVEADIRAAHTHLVESAGFAIADEWETGLFAALFEIAATPRRQVAGRESRLLGQAVRRVVYRRTPTSGAAYHIYFRLIETEQENTVEVLHIRHAARRPLTRAQASELRRALGEQDGD